MTKITLDADFDNLDEIRDFVGEVASQVGFSDKEIYSIQLAADEASSNIIEHAYGGEGLGDIEITCNHLEDGLEVVLRDKGVKFNPDEVSEIDIGVPLEELGYRGAGVYLMNKLMDEVHYEFTRDKGTTLKMRKKK